VNEETQGLRDQVKTYQDAIRERDNTVKARDQEISELKASGTLSNFFPLLEFFDYIPFCPVDDLRYELQAEIERGKSLSSQKQPDSASRARRGRVLNQNEDPKMAEVVRFYEDLTNLLVTDIKPQPARYLQLEDWLLTCVYSHRDVVATRSSPAKSVFSFDNSTFSALTFYQACLSNYDCAMNRIPIWRENQRARMTSPSRYNIHHLNWRKRRKHSSRRLGF
jgi:hypothetical protein